MLSILTVSKSSVPDTISSTCKKGPSHQYSPSIKSGAMSGNTSNPKDIAARKLGSRLLAMRTSTIQDSNAKGAQLPSLVSTGLGQPILAATGFAEGWVLCILPQCIAHRSQCICPLHRQYLYTSHQARDWHSEVASSSAEASCLQLQLHHVPVPGRETQAVGSTTLVTLKYHFWVPKASTRVLATSKLGGIPLSDNATDLFIRGTTSRLAVGAWLRAGTARVTQTVSECRAAGAP